MWAHDPCPTDLAPDDGMVSFLIGTKRSVWGSGYFWGETLWNSYFLASILRYTITLEGTWLVNSAAHMYGKQPYDKLSSPWQNPLVGLGAIDLHAGGPTPPLPVGIFLTCKFATSEARGRKLWSQAPVNTANLAGKQRGSAAA
ncbi:Stearoyl-CoA desaturase 5 [Cricetulus griseus]|uniref:Stearoyl-CoA desaturase 5 n=1 Tax=Cricetulus griseus TaxID=10029 RepID=G3I787_CRIGR|nr:Stearoyl-CoA desaturase 5 [Cricetulus griseus]